MRKRITVLALALSLLTVVALPAQSTYAARPLTCTFTTTTGDVYSLRLSADLYSELTSLGYGGTTTVRYHGRTYTVTNMGTETNRFVVTYDSMTVTGILSCRS